MADERDFELLDDYLSNRMAEADRADFGRKLKADPALQQAYTLQKQLIEGIRNARAMELKAMLNKVPVPPANPGSTLVSKVVLGAVVSLVAAGGAYWYFNVDEPQPTLPAVTQEPPKADTPAVIEKKDTPRPEAKQPAIRSAPRIEADKNQTSAGTEHSKPSLAKRPDPLHSPAPQSKPDETQTGNTANSGESAPLLIETAPAQAEHSFHYQFIDGKLVLFGPFSKNNYETRKLLVNGQTMVFLRYRDQYYALDRTDTTIQALKPVTDPNVLKRLQEPEPAQ